MKNKKAIRKAVEKIQETKIMQNFYNEKFIKHVKKNLHKLSKEERLKLLFKMD